MKNAVIAWETIFPGQKCILLHKRPEYYETFIYIVKYFKSDIVKTNSHVNPYKLKVRIDIESWSSKEKRTSIQEALANVEEKGDRISGLDTAEFPLTGIYKIKDGKWVFSMGNRSMMNFIKRARAKHNGHVDISRIIAIHGN